MDTTPLLDEHISQNNTNNNTVSSKSSKYWKYLLIPILGGIIGGLIGTPIGILVGILSGVKATTYIISGITGFSGMIGFGISHKKIYKKLTKYLFNSKSNKCKKDKEYENLYKNFAKKNYTISNEHKYDIKHILHNIPSNDLSELNKQLFNVYKERRLKEKKLNSSNKKMVISDVHHYINTLTKAFHNSYIDLNYDDRNVLSKCIKEYVFSCLYNP